MEREEVGTEEVYGRTDEQFEIRELSEAELDLIGGGSGKTIKPTY